MCWHKGTGRVIYNPYRAGMKKKIENWCVLDVDKEITRYYRWWVQKEKWVNLELPSWNAHASIVRGEYICPELAPLWRKYQGETFEFEYEHSVRQSLDTKEEGYGAFWFIDVHCVQIDQLRAELGLKTFFKYHITIGRTYY